MKFESNLKKGICTFLMIISLTGCTTNQKVEKNIEEENNVTSTQEEKTDSSSKNSGASEEYISMFGDPTEFSKEGESKVTYKKISEYENSAIKDISFKKPGTLKFTTTKGHQVGTVIGNSSEVNDEYTATQEGIYLENINDNVDSTLGEGIVATTDSKACNFEVKGQVTEDTTCEYDVSSSRYAGNGYLIVATSNLTNQVNIYIPDDMYDEDYDKYNENNSEKVTAEDIEIISSKIEDVDGETTLRVEVNNSTSKFIDPNDFVVTIESDNVEVGARTMSPQNTKYDNDFYAGIQNLFSVYGNLANYGPLPNSKQIYTTTLDSNINIENTKFTFEINGEKISEE